MKSIFTCCFLFLVLFSQAQSSEDFSFTKDLKAYEGYFDFYWSEKEGKIWLSIEKLDTEFLYISSLQAGIGSNDIGLDRGQLGQERIVKFQRVGPKVLLVQPNYRYRASTTNPMEKLAVEEAFAQSVIWGFKVEDEANGKVLVDATSFFMRDAHGVAETLKSQNEGSYGLDESRSAIHLPNCKSFPKNTEWEATLTFTGKPTGRYLNSVTPDGSAVTVRQHHSFVALPEPGYQAREFDPRGGYFSMSYYDYATPIDQPLEKKWIYRHRLEKVDPMAKVSEVKEPIVYYLDPGTPEPVRSALLGGARWWAQAFEAAGFKNAFKVEIMPDDVDPMDIRYNIIQWVHRSTRGWSYGSTVADPRTGEIIKGKVTLGSLRVRQDYLIATGLLSPFDGKNDTEAAEKLKQMALARLRQLSAHEVGHTLGLAHNYISSVNNRASVMDYPHPLIEMKGGKLDLSNAYDSKIGDWDKVSIEWGYAEFPKGTDAKKELDKLLEKAFKKGLRFISDQDARPMGGAHAYAHLWDNGKDAADELNRLMEIRKMALQNLSEKSIRSGQPMATLEEVLVPIYLLHRYQVDAASKMVGGMDYHYQLKDGFQPDLEILPKVQQQKAAKALIATLAPDALMLPESLLGKIPPRPIGYGRHRETFGGRTGTAFDPLGAAESAASISLQFLLHPERATRLVQQKAIAPDQYGFDDLLQTLTDELVTKTPSEGYAGEVQRLVGKLTLYQLMHLGKDKRASGQVQAMVQHQLENMASYFAQLESELNEGDFANNAHFRFLQGEINKFLTNPEKMDIPSPQSPPPGSPIGMMCGEH